jgi:GNAT superfamily N-acetyltransferase
MDVTTLEFRPAAVGHGDGAALAAAMAAEIAVLYDGLDQNGPQMPAAGPAQLGPPDGGFWVGYVGDVRVCCGGIKRLDATACEIKKMYVVPAARGRGLAHRLLAFLEDTARSLGYTVARLDTGPAQPDSQHIYEKVGYRPIDNFNANPVATYFGEKSL